MALTLLVIPPPVPLHSAWNTPVRLDPALRGSYVVPPKVPRLAPDGLPYGAVGTVGPVGQVGPSVFSPGSAHAIGVTPCAGAGCSTLINANSYWGNETYTLNGNVTIPAGKTLTVDDSSLTFAESSTAVSYAYGFNVTGVLVLQRGSLVTQATSATNSFYVWQNCTVAVPHVLVSNTTLRAISVHVVKTQVCAGQADGVHQAIAFGVGWFNFSAFYGSTLSFAIGVPYGFSTAPAPNAQLNGGAVHSYFHAAELLTWSTWRNDTFDGSAFHLVGWPTIVGGLEVVNDAFVNLSAASDPYVATTLMGSQIENLTIQATLFNHDNLSNPATLQDFYAGYGGGLYLAFNDTFENVWTWGMSSVLLGAEPVCTVTVEHLSAINLTSSGVVGKEGHISIVSVSGAYNGTPGIPASQVLGQTLTFEYNLVNGVHSSYLTENNLVQGSDPVDRVRWNLFENFTNAAIAHPLGSNQIFSVQDNGQQIYSTLGPDVPVGSPALGHTSAVFSGNWLVNSIGQNWLLQVANIVSGGGVQPGGDQVTGNIVENLSSSGGIGVAVNSGEAGAYVANNTCYGVYNFSNCYGSNEGAAVGTTYSGNAAFNVDATSWAAWSMDSAETFRGPLGSLFLQNENDSVPPGGQLVWKNLTTVVNLAGATATAINATALQPSTGATWRSVLPTDFNISATNSTLPPSLYVQASQFSSRYPGTYSPTTHANPNFLRLLGYAGLQAGGYYPIASSWIHGEVSLPLQFGNATVAMIPGLNALGHVYTFEAASNQQFTVGADATAATNVPIFFNGLNPGGTYLVTETNATSGATIGTSSATANGTGSAAALFSPAAGILNATFSVSCPGSCAPPLTSVGALTFLGLPWALWILLLVLVVAAAVGALAGRLTT